MGGVGSESEPPWLEVTTELPGGFDQVGNSILVIAARDRVGSRSEDPDTERFHVLDVVKRELAGEHCPES